VKKVPKCKYTQSEAEKQTDALEKRKEILKGDIGGVIGR